MRSYSTSQSLIRQEVISIFIELYDDDEKPMYINVNNIETMRRVEFAASDKEYTIIQMISGETFYAIEKPEKILNLIEQEKFEERKANTICLT